MWSQLLGGQPPPMQNLMSPYERVRRNAAGPVLPKLETLLHCGTKRLAMSPPESTQLSDQRPLGGRYIHGG